jgi:NAD(P)-dependent dehydrogenase (short-subunit alcohol dehydrogenase family)/rhamnose utilization protein RhaD (predicted bifunctional aldolase and dehydrogenase)
MSLKTIAGLSNFYGKDPAYVLAGGGNTSYKDENFLYVKPSGISLAAIKEKDFVKMDRKKLGLVFSEKAPEGSSEREAFVKQALAAAVCYNSSGRPSVETPLHDAIQYRFVVHLHPAVVNGMTCGKSGREICAALFPESHWVEYTNPGHTLAVRIKSEIAKFAKAGLNCPKVIFLQNHGVFVGADTALELKKIYSEIMSKLTSYCRKKNIRTDLVVGEEADREAVAGLSPKLRSWLSQNAERAAVTSCGYFKAAGGPLTPDHIVYSKSFALSSSSPDKTGIAKFAKANGYKPLVVELPSKAVFCAGETLKDSMTCLSLAKDAALVEQIAEGFGGVNYLSKPQRSFIENWEVESYRKKVGAGSGGSLRNKIVVITGAAQGFGLGIAESLAEAGATVAVCDINMKGAEKAAASICALTGRDYAAFAVSVDVSDESSVEKMADDIVGICGGMDVFIANAGVLKAGPLKNFEKKDWDFVTAVNYSGYFLCAKRAAIVMSAQNAEGGRWSDIIQINSKSGLVGSSRNAAYSGGKFGGIGLTQSFALELIEDKIKVNSICPGNFFEGPLWSDPEKGLLVQYLKSGKVPGAKNIADVKKFYEAKIPMGRGCRPVDVAMAIIYCVEQVYETGQAIPVTGGQVMLS